MKVYCCRGSRLHRDAAEPQLRIAFSWYHQAEETTNYCSLQISPHALPSTVSSIQNCAPTGAGVNLEWLPGCRWQQSEVGLHVGKQKWLLISRCAYHNRTQPPNLLVSSFLMLHINEPHLRWLCLLTEGKRLVYLDDSHWLLKNAAFLLLPRSVWGFLWPCSNSSHKQALEGSNALTEEDLDLQSGARVPEKGAEAQVPIEKKARFPTNTATCRETSYSGGLGAARVVLLWLFLFLASYPTVVLSDQQTTATEV